MKCKLSFLLRYRGTGLIHVYTQGGYLDRSQIHLFVATFKKKHVAQVLSFTWLSFVF